MPQTTNYKFPLWADTPPEGATGKTLRDAILGSGSESLANMADAAIAGVQKSVPPIDYERMEIEWDGDTAGLVEANGSIQYYDSTGTTYKYYKISNSPIVSDVDLKLIGEPAMAEGTAVMTIKLKNLSRTYSLKRVADGLYAVLYNAGFFWGDKDLPLVFSVHTPNAAYRSNAGSLTFPETGFYVLEAVSDTGRISGVKTVPIVYNPDTMPDVAIETTSHKVTAITEEMTDEQYPSAKAVWDALPKNIPVRTSDLENDSGYITASDIPDIPAIPTSTSELLNDSGFITSADIPSIDTSGLEDAGNKVRTYNDWDNTSEEKYPSTKAVHDFVYQHIDQYGLSVDMLINIYNWYIHPEMNHVELNTLTWSGDTEGRVNFLSMFYKIGDYTEFPDNYKFESPRISSDYFPTFTNGKITDLKEAFGIVIYTFGYYENTGTTPLVVVADRDGTLPAAVIEQIMGTNPGMDVPYVTGVYVNGTQDAFVSKIVSQMTTKDYIDRKFAQMV